MHGIGLRQTTCFRDMKRWMPPSAPEAISQCFQSANSRNPLAIDLAHSCPPALAAEARHDFGQRQALRPRQLELTRRGNALPLWRRHRGPIKKDGPVVELDVYAFMTTTPNALVATVNHERMRVLLATEHDHEAWLNGGVEEALALVKPSRRKA